MKTVFFCLFSFLIFNTYAQNTRHIGIWKGVDGDKTITLTLHKDGFFIMEAQGMVYGGKEFELEGKKMSTPYEIEYTSESPKFTIMMKNLETDEIESKMVGTITFKEKNTAYICMKRSYDDDTEVTFEEKDCLLFTKTK